MPQTGDAVNPSIGGLGQGLGGYPKPYKPSWTSETIPEFFFKPPPGIVGTNWLLSPRQEMALKKWWNVPIAEEAPVEAYQTQQGREAIYRWQDRLTGEWRIGPNPLKQGQSKAQPQISGSSVGGAQTMPKGTGTERQSSFARAGENYPYLEEIQPAVPSLMGQTQVAMPQMPSAQAMREMDAAGLGDLVRTYITNIAKVQENTFSSMMQANWTKPKSPETRGTKYKPAKQQ